jgi:hypothetical protein
MSLSLSSSLRGTVGPHPRKCGPLDYYEFVSADTASLLVATADPDPARVPGAALASCREWVFSRGFKLGDGSHSPELDASIAVQVAAVGYLIYVRRTVI